MTQNLTATVQHKIPRWIREPDGKGGFDWVQRGYTSAELRIVVDPDQIANAIGDKAIKNKNHRSQLQSGAVIVEAFNIRKIEEVKP